MTKSVTLNVTEIRNLLGNELFSVSFNKRAKKPTKKVPNPPVETRTMTCRLHVKKFLAGGTQKHDAVAKGLVNCWIPPMNRAADAPESDKGYRSFGVESINYIRAHGRKYVPQGDQLVEVENDA